ncbi:RNase adapter RapZ [Litorisediminicola beolgyonensis]|uniref:RNase adapter RapZ n=1 Tax=Litorisediminicola beolgyonensis TaxID=1173614 RepID=A0ABW3ZN88_9RHOB
MTQHAQRVVLVTGPSGAGRATAINALEDFGFEAIDNIPLSLIPRLLDGPVALQPMALGVDVRNRDFSVDAFIELALMLGRRPELELELLYLDCATDVLVRRFSETRRRHPLATDSAPEQAIAQEKTLLEPLRAVSDTLIDTSSFSPHDLRAALENWFGRGTERGLAVSLNSFSYKRGLPMGADMVIDCRFLANPHWVPDLRALTGRDAAVVAHVAADPRHAEFLERITGMLTFLLPAHRAEGKSHFTIGFGCTGGQHRSVAVTESVAAGLAEAGWRVSIRHRELERRGMVPGPGDAEPR